jgi:hypothetical protein
MTKTWHANINWSGDGSTFVDEGGNLQNLSMTRGRLNWLKSDSTGFENIPAGEITLTVKDYDRRFDPFYIPSPLYPSVLPTRKLKVSVVEGSTYNVFTGYIDNIYPDFSSGKRQTIIHAVEGQKALSGNYSSTIQSNIRIDTAIASILSAVSWPDGSVIDSISDYLPYWGGSGASALDEIYKLVECGLAKFFIAADGKLKIYGRLRNPAVVETLTGTSVMLDVGVPMPWDVVKNSISMVVNGLINVPDVELFKMGSKVGINNGQTVEIWANYSYANQSVAGININAPVFTVNTLSNGTGSDLSLGCSATITAFTNTAKIELTNSSGFNGFITSTILTGDALVPYSSNVNAQDATSISKYFEQDFIINNPWQQNQNTATDFANALLALMKDAQQYPQVKLRNQTALQFTPDLFDWVNVNISDMSINSNFALGYIQHDWMDQSGQNVDTQFRFEPVLVPNITYWKFPASLGVDTVFAF